MTDIAFDQFAVTRLADFARALTALHAAARRQVIADDQFDRAFHAVCRSVWGYTTDDFEEALVSPQDQAFLDRLDERQAQAFARSHGYDLCSDEGVLLSDWWGFCWMIMAEERGLLTPENRAAARAAFEEQFLDMPNVIGFVVAR